MAYNLVVQDGNIYYKTPSGVDVNVTINGNLVVTGNISGTFTGNAVTASKLQTARTLSATGDAAWSVNFDGSANVTSPIILATVNASPVNLLFQKITVNGKGLVTGTSSVTSTDIVNSLGYTPLNVAGGTMTGLLTLSGDPVNPLNPATKQYVDSAAAGLNIRAACQTSTTAVLPSCTYDNGAGGVGATLTATANGSINSPGLGGYTSLVVTSRVLVANQADQIQNGIYVVTALGDGSNPWILTRSSDFDGTPTTEVQAGDLTFIQSGTLSGTQWVQINTGTGVHSAPTYNFVVVGTDPIIFSQFSGASTYTAGAGINIASNIISNIGVLSLTTNTGLSTNVSATGAVTVTNTGVTSAIGGSGISVSSATGPVTISAVSIPNSSLLNSSVGVGSTNIVLGTSATTITGLTSLTSTTLVGALTGAASLNVLKAGDSMTGNLSFDGIHTITNVPLPVSGTDVANKNYVDTALVGLSWKNAATAATTANLTAAYSGGATPTLTNTGTQVVFSTDGYTAVNGDRILVKNQTIQTQNGIYNVTNAGSGSTNWVLTRASDANTTILLNNATIFVTNGTLNSNVAYTQTTPNPVINSSNIVFTQFTGSGGSYIAGTGLSLIGNTFANTGVLSNVAGTGITVSSASGNVTIGTSNIPNASLANSSIGIGSSNIALGGGTTTLAGLASVTSTNFVGALTGHSSLDLPLTGGTLTGNLSVNSAASTISVVSSAAAGATLELAGNGNVVGTSGFLIRQAGDSRGLLINRPAADLVLGTNGNTQQTITSSGISVFTPISGTGSAPAVTTVRGASSYTPNVQVLGGQSNGSAILAARYSVDASPPILTFAKSRSASINSQAILSSGDLMGDIEFSGSDGASFQNGARISAQVDGTPAAGSMPGRLVFSVTPTGSNIVTEAMRIASNGTVGIGASPAGATVKLTLSDTVITTLLGFNYSSNTISGIGTNSNHALGFLTNGAERMRITNTGAVGFGMTPVTQYDFASTGGMLRVGGASGNNLIQSYSSTTALGLWAGGSSQIYSSGSLNLQVGATTGTGAPTGGNSGLFIDAAGNVGIGTTNPVTKLDVRGQIAAQSTAPNSTLITLTKQDSGTASQNGQSLQFVNLNATNTGRASDVQAGRIYWQFSQPTSGNAQDAASITAAADGAQSGTSTQSYLSFATAPGSAGALVERMRIDSAGNVGIGTQSPSTYGKLAVVGGLISIDSTATNVGQIIQNNGNMTISSFKGTGSYISIQNADTAGSVAESVRIDTSRNMTVAGSVTATQFNGSAAGLTGTSGINISGNAATSTKLLTARTIALSGAATGTATAFDGTANISIPVTSLSATSISGTIPSGNLSGTYAISISGNAATATNATAASTATLAAKASTLAQGGSNGAAMTFNYSGNSGQPTWLWGTSDGTNVSVWNPSQFSVASANNATLAANTSSVAGATANSYSWTNQQTFLTSSSVGIGGPAGFLVAISNSAGSTSAAMTFLRNSVYAVNMGLDTDNVFRLGGYSDGAGVYRWTSDTVGNFAVRGNINAGGIVTSPGLSGFASGPYAAASRNPIWRFTSPNDGYGLSYFQGSSGLGGNDSIGIHFGTATSAASSLNISGTAVTASVPFVGSLNGNAATATTATTANAVISSAARTDSTAYPIVWNTTAGTSQNYSCSAVTITSSTGTINCSALVSSGEVTAYSDSRLKTDIKVIPDALNKVEKLRGVTFTRTDDAHIGQKQTGVIAQEVRDVLPEAVKEDDNGMLSVAYGNMVGLLIEAVKELTTQNKALLARIETLEKK